MPSTTYIWSNARPACHHLGPPDVEDAMYCISDLDEKTTTPHLHIGRL